MKRAAQLTDEADEADEKSCPDGYFIEPVLQNRCPLPKDVKDLAECRNATLGTICTGGEDCGWSKLLWQYLGLARVWRPHHS